MSILRAKLTLGELEAEIMEIVWKLQRVYVRDVLDILEKKRKIAYTTIMTVMSRLYEKGLLGRKLDQTGAYRYHPLCDKDTFLKRASKKAIYDIIKEFGDVAVAQFIDVIDRKNIKELKEWKKKLNKVK